MVETLNIGSVFPQFELFDKDNVLHRLSDYTGKKVVIYFYPKDNTSGCTRQSIEFTTQLDSFKKHGVVVIGISPDSPMSHQKFIEKHSLRITLLSDKDTQICSKAGVWVEKSMYGKKYMGVERTTFLLDEKSTIIAVWNKVKVAGHVEDVLRRLDTQ